MLQDLFDQVVEIDEVVIDVASVMGRHAALQPSLESHIDRKQELGGKCWPAFLAGHEHWLVVIDALFEVIEPLW